MKNRFATAVVLLVMAFGGTEALAQGGRGGRGGTPTSPVSNLVTLLRTETVPDQAMKDVKAIWETDRWFTFPKFEETAANVAAMMRRAGLEDVEIGKPP